ncbi:MAG: transposase mutator type [Acidobacteria bacterium]|nr:transposase mutator type [Acidobacteriota bacterium]
MLSGSTWQRCRVLFMRNLLATVPQGAREAIAMIVRTIFAQPDHASAMTQLRKVAEGLRTRLVGAILLEHDDEWAVAERRYFSAESMKLPTTPLLSTTTQELLAAIG